MTVHGTAATRKSVKARFRAALAIAHMTQESWAAANGVTAGHLSQVLSGRHPSRRLMDKIEAFTTEQLKKAKAA